MAEVLTRAEIYQFLAAIDAGEINLSEDDGALSQAEINSLLAGVNGYEPRS